MNDPTVNADALTELSGWGRRPRSGAWVADPAGRDDLVGAVRTLRPPRGLLARGLGRSYNDAALNAGGVVLRTPGVNRMRAFDPLTGSVTVDAGLSLHQLIRAVLPHGWFPAVVPGTAYVTVGGAIAADIHGKNHHRDGGFCRWTRAFVLQPPGVEPRTVTPDGDPEGFWATAGGMGLTGVIVEATLQLLPVETAWVRVDTVRTADLDDTIVKMAESDVRYRYAVAWLDLAPGGDRFGRGVISNADHATRGELPIRLLAQPLDAPLRAGLPVPDVVPSGLLQPVLMRTLNTAWSRHSRPGTSFQPVSKYLFPLDRLSEWNRLYGRRGFLQYQCVVPEADSLRAVAAEVRAARCPVVLAVLKRFGPQVGYLSFPMPGWTLTLDLPVGGEGLPQLLNRCDDLVASAGGRVYLAKDSRVGPDAFRAMYPRHRDWLGIRDGLDDQRRLCSDLARRLRMLG